MGEGSVILVADGLICCMDGCVMGLDSFGCHWRGECCCYWYEQACCKNVSRAAGAIIYTDKQRVGVVQYCASLQTAEAQASYHHVV